MLFLFIFIYIFFISALIPFDSEKLVVLTLLLVLLFITIVLLASIQSLLDSHIYNLLESFKILINYKYENCIALEKVILLVNNLVISTFKETYSLLHFYFFKNKILILRFVENYYFVNSFYKVIFQLYNIIYIKTVFFDRAFNRYIMCLNFNFLNKKMIQGICEEKIKIFSIKFIKPLNIVTKFSKKDIYLF